jgi:hypothetical protein
MTTSKCQIQCTFCGEPRPDLTNCWWPSEDGGTCQDCWEAEDEPVTSFDIEALKQEIDRLVLPEEFDIPSNPFDLGTDFYQLGVECAKESRN